MIARLPVFDALRGLAAIFVVTRHNSEFFGFFLFRTYLAVDIFFLLSGFVIAASYETKLLSGVMTRKAFIISRLIRLLPMYWISILLAFAVSQPKSVLEIVKSLFLVPTLSGGDELFPVNGVYWSLFFELTVNFLYAYFQPKLTNRVIITVVVAAGIVLMALSILKGSIDFGYRGNFVHLTAGFTRAGFEILLGILLFRVGSISFPKWLTGWAAIIPILTISITFCLMSIGKADVVIDLLAVMIVFPSCVLVAAQSRQSPRSAAVMTFVGVASYPLYLMHGPLGTLIDQIAPSAVRNNSPLSGVLFLVGAIPASFLIERFIDEPMRRFLKRKTWLPQAA